MKVDMKKLEEIVGKENVSDEIGDRYVYGSDSSVHFSMPACVVRPRNTQDVQQIMKYANKNKIPVVARGAGSGMSGHAVPLAGGIVLDMKQMNKIIEIRPEDVYCKVEPGVINDELNRQLKPYGFFFPPTTSI